MSVNINSQSPPPPLTNLTDLVQWNTANILQMKGRLNQLSSGGSGSTPTLNQVLTQGNTTTKGMYVGASAPTTYSVYVGPRITPADGSGQILLHDVPDGSGHYFNFISLAASNTTTAASVHLSSGDQTSGPSNDIIITCLQTDTTTSSVVQVADMHSNKVNIYPSIIKFTDTSFSAGNSIQIINKVLTSSRVQSLPDTTGIIGVARNSRLQGQSTAVSGLVNQTVGALDATYVLYANVYITSGSSFSFNTLCSYTDEGNNARNAAFNFSIPGTNTLNPLISNAGGSVPYMSGALCVRCKAASTLSVVTSGTFTTIGYNIDCSWVQVG